MKNRGDNLPSRYKGLKSEPAERKRQGIFPSQVQNTLTIQKELQNFLTDSGYHLGKAYGEGDGFYDACASALNEIKKTRGYDIESLRKLCSNYAHKLEELYPVTTVNAKEEDKKNNWIFQALQRDIFLYQQYLLQSEFTTEKVKYLKDNYKIGDGYAVWGEQDIDAKIICAEYQVKLHVIEINEEALIYPEKDLPLFIHRLIDTNKTHSLESTSPELFSDPKIMHLVIYRNHCVPLLKQPLPHSLDLPFTNGNHFEQLEFVGCDPEKSDTSIYLLASSRSQNLLFRSMNMEKILSSEDILYCVGLCYLSYSLQPNENNPFAKSGHRITPQVKFLRELTNTWTLIPDTADYNNGFFGFYNIKKKTIIFIFRGTRFCYSDFQADFAIANGKLPENRMKLAEEFIIQSRDILKERIEDTANYTIYYSGHSLGGYIAEALVAYCFEHSPNHTAITFDSPGLPTMKPNMEQHNIFGFVGLPNIVNTSGFHAGSLHYVPLMKNPQSWGDALKSYVLKTAASSSKMSGSVLNLNEVVTFLTISAIKTLFDSPIIAQVFYLLKINDKQIIKNMLDTVEEMKERTKRNIEDNLLITKILDTFKEHRLERYLGTIYDNRNFFEKIKAHCRMDPKLWPNPNDLLGKSKEELNKIEQYRYVGTHTFTPGTPTLDVNIYQEPEVQQGFCLSSYTSYLIMGAAVLIGALGLFAYKANAQQLGEDTLKDLISNLKPP